MDSAIQAVSNELTNRNLSGYQLTTLLIRNGKKLGLTPSELLVFTALSSYWNGRPVNPKINTLADNTALSEKSVRTALNGLLDKGYVIKSKRGKNANIYNLNVNAVILTVESGKNNRTSAVKSTAPCNMKLNHEKLEETTTREHMPAASQKPNVVAFLKKSSHKTVTIEDVPEILRNKKGIDNPCAYWASLSAEVKNEYLQKQREKEEQAAKKLKRAEEEKAAKAAAAAELERIKNEPPFWEVCNRAEAIEHLKIFAKPNLRPLLHKGYRVDLLNRFNIDISELS